MKEHKIRIAVDRVGMGKCFLDDIDISSCVNGVEIGLKAGDLNNIKLSLVANVEIELAADAGQLSGRILTSEEITALSSTCVERRLTSGQQRPTTPQESNAL